MARAMSALVLCLAVAAASNGATIETIAGTGRPENNGDRGEARRVNIGQPFGVEIGPDRCLYVCEVQNHRVWRVDLSSGRAEVVAGNGQRGYRGDGGPAIEAAMNEPYEVRFDRAGNLLVVEMQNHLVRRVDAKTGRVSTVAGTGRAGFSGDGGQARQAQLRTPHSIALDGEDRIYIADIGNHRIRRVNRDGTIETVAGDGRKVLPKDGQPAVGHPLLGPRALFVEGRLLWIALREGHGVWTMDLDQSRLRHVAGRGTAGATGDGGPAAMATFNGPKGIAVTAEAVDVVDTENQVIRRIDRSTGTISTLAGSGQRGFDGDGGPASKAALNRPHGVCVGPDGAVYIGDSENHRVRVVRP